MVQLCTVSAFVNVALYVSILRVCQQRGVCMSRQLKILEDYEGTYTGKEDAPRLAKWAGGKETRLYKH